jgi:hypothetical protein
MIIDDKYRFIFIGIAKTGTQSIQAVLGGDSTVPPEKYHSSIKTIHSQCPDKYKQYFKFAFVRNPWDRFVSMYFDFTQNTGHFYWSKDLLEYKNFNEFCLDFPQSKWKEWIHFLPQFDMLSIDNELAMDFIGRFENLSTDFMTVCNKLYLPKVNLPTLQKSNRDKNYRSYYDHNTTKIIEKIYGKDINEFGYEF